MALFSIIEAFGKNLHLPWRFHDEIKTINVRLDGANYRYWLIFKEKCGYLPMPIFYTMQDNSAKALSITNKPMRKSSHGLATLLHRALVFNY